MVLFPIKGEKFNQFFKGLGWDVDNVSGAAPRYRALLRGLYYP